MRNSERTNSVGAQAASPEEANVSEIIHNNLNAILNRENEMYQKLRDFECFLFGGRENEQGEGSDSVIPESWNEKIRDKLDRISDIQHKQIESFNNISKFHL